MSLNSRQSISIIATLCGVSCVISLQRHFLKILPDSKHVSTPVNKNDGISSQDFFPIFFFFESICFLIIVNISTITILFQTMHRNPSIYIYNEKLEVNPRLSS